MITLLIINTSGLTLIPTTILALRKAYGAEYHVEIIPIVVLATTLSTIFAITVLSLVKK